MTNTKLENLTEEEKKLVASILKEYSDTGSSNKLTSLLYEDWKEIPVDINTFLHNPKYLGRGLVDGEGRFTLFPYWEELLKKIYPDPLKPATCNTLALTGAIGIGKSTEAVIIGAYELYRIMCLVDPSVYYGIMSTDTISFAVINITLEASRGVAWDKFQNLIQSSEWFQAHGRMAGNVKPEWEPDPNRYKIDLICGSQPRHFIGKALFWSFFDEISFIPNQDVEKQKQKATELISSATARMQSRFMRDNVNPTIMVLASSKRTEQSFLETWIENKKKNNSKTTLIVDEPQWVIRQDKQSDRTFKVGIGNKFLPSEVLSPEATEEDAQKLRDKGYRIIEVPIGYYENFIDDIDIALTDIAGISTTSLSTYISGERLAQTKIDGSNPFVKDIITVGNGIDDDAQYSDFFDLSLVPPEMKKKPMFIHLDMSLSGDKTGIAGVWLKGKKLVAEDKVGKDTLYQVAFSVSVKAPRGNQVSFEKTRNFIQWLKDQGFVIKFISMDTFQSADMLQALLDRKFNAGILSVDRVDSDRICKPYQYLKSCIYEQRILIPKTGTVLLTEELLGLERNNNSGKVDHSPSGINCFTGDTKIKMLDGNDKTILELLDDYNNGKSNYVYTFNHETELIEPKLIKKVFKSGTNAKLVEITLDNNEVIRCTPEHKFMLRHGEYLEASELLPGDSLMPLYTKYPSKGLSKYRMYYEPMEDAWHYEHRRFAKEVLDEKHLVHHKDCNPKNNRPDNLIWMSKTSHMLEHAKYQTGAQSPEARKKRSYSVKLSHKNVDNTKNGRLRYYSGSIEERLIKQQRHIDNELKHDKFITELSTLFNVDYNKLDSETKRRCLAIYANYKAGNNVSFDLSKLTSKELKKIEKQNQLKACDYYNVDINSLTRYEIHGLVIKYYYETIPGYKEHIADEVSKNHKLGKYQKAKEAIADRIWWTNGQTGKENNLYLKASDNPPEGFWRGRTLKNHKVISIKFVDYTEDVYDIEVEDNHNFALAAGIFVHNSKDSADAVCGATWTASLHAEEYAYEYGESLEVLTDFNDNNVYYTDELEKSMLNLYKPENKDNFIDFGFGKAEELQFGIQEGLMIW